MKEWTIMQRLPQSIRAIRVCKDWEGKTTYVDIVECADESLMAKLLTERDNQPDSFPGWRKALNAIQIA